MCPLRFSPGDSIRLEIPKSVEHYFSTSNFKKAVIILQPFDVNKERIGLVSGPTGHLRRSLADLLEAVPSRGTIQR